MFASPFRAGAAMTNAIVRIAEIILEVVVTVVSLVIARFVPAT